MAFVVDTGTSWLLSVTCDKGRFSNLLISLSLSFKPAVDAVEVADIVWKKKDGKQIRGDMPLFFPD